LAANQLDNQINWHIIVTASLGS